MKSEIIQRELVIKVENHSSKAIPSVMLFGAYKDLVDINQDDNVRITVKESSYFHVKTMLLEKPFRILGLKCVATNAAQLRNTLKLYHEDSDGGQTMRGYTPMKSRRGIVLKREDPNFEFLVTEYKYIKFKLNAKTSITFIFNIFEREGKDSTPLTRIEIDRFLKPDNASKIKINKEHGSAIPALGPEQLSVDHMLSINQRCMGGGMSQNYAALYFLEYYIKFFKFEYVIEFGTQKGALALYLANMAMVTEQFEFDTIDISDKDYYDRANEGVGYWLDRISNNAITARRVSIFKNDLFDPGFVKAIAATIKGIGKTLIIADNGDKPREYDTYTPVMKSGDHILLHDWEVEYRASQIVQVKNPQDFVMNRVQGWAEKAQELRTTFMPFEKYVY